MREWRGALLTAVVLLIVIVIGIGIGIGGRLLVVLTESHQRTPAERTEDLLIYMTASGAVIAKQSGGGQEQVFAALLRELRSRWPENVNSEKREVYDGWGNAILFLVSVRADRGTVPITCRSAGPDGVWGTVDDLDLNAEVSTRA